MQIAGKPAAFVMETSLKSKMSLIIHSKIVLLIDNVLCTDFYDLNKRPVLQLKRPKPICRRFYIKFE